MVEGIDVSQRSRIHLLDVGQDQYGDAVLCKFGNRVVMIDGAHPGDDNGSPGHPSIPEQLGTLLNDSAPFSIDLLIVTHAHQDHIGCLPKLIKDGVLDVKWALVADPGLGWGRSEIDAAAEGIDDRALSLAAALREEIRVVRPDNRDEINEFLADAVTLEETYKKMLKQLEDRGTRVVRHGRDSLDAILNEFQDIKLDIIGPPQDHLLICAEIISNVTDANIRMVSDVFARDADVSVIDAYAGITRSITKALDTPGADAPSRPGPAINLQSIITQFEYGGHKFLFAGDFQFAKPELNNADLATSVRRLRKKISHQAPYSFVKLSHHGSFNSFSEEILAELGGTKYFGLCAGEESTHHPSRKVLELLDEHRDAITWARTDHNGQVTLLFKKNVAKPIITPTQGELNDAEPNDSDTGESRPVPVATGGTTAGGSATRGITTSRSATGTAGRGGGGGESGDFVEVNVRIPRGGTRVKFSGDFTFEVDDTGAGDGGAGRRTAGSRPSDSTLLIGGGRPAMRDLLFVTSADALPENIGATEARQLLGAISDQGIPLYDQLPAGLSSSTDTSGLVSAALRAHPQTKGVVLLGGYDVIPAQILDCLPAQLRAAMPHNEDPDNFVVWSDDVYGDSDGDGLPEVPVTRIPDGKSSSLLLRAIAATPSSTVGRRFGIRNIARPFAKTIFDALPGSEALHLSKTTVFDQQPALNLDAAKMYFMLHGDYTDGSRFWGEGTPMNREAFNVYNIPSEVSGVVFSGCCWGALTVNTPAGLVRANRPYGQKTVDASLALSFLARGAIAFVGCTGAHYSPVEPPYNYFGGPIHTAFWRNLQAGMAPAQALFDAKIEYVRDMPHGRTGPLQLAVEYKILRQYTCLGLGW